MGKRQGELFNYFWIGDISSYNLKKKSVTTSKRPSLARERSLSQFPMGQKFFPNYNNLDDFRVAGISMTVILALISTTVISWLHKLSCFFNILFFLTSLVEIPSFWVFPHDHWVKVHDHFFRDCHSKDTFRL